MSALIEGYTFHRDAFDNRLDHLSNSITIQNLSRRDVHGNTALHIACFRANYEAASLLLDSGASIRDRNLAGCTPLDEALASGRRDLVQLLIRKGDGLAEEKWLKEKDYLDLKELLKNNSDFALKLSLRKKKGLGLLLPWSTSCEMTLHKWATCLRLDITRRGFIRTERAYVLGEDTNGGRLFHKARGQWKVTQEEYEMPPALASKRSNELLKRKLRAKLMDSLKVKGPSENKRLVVNSINSTKFDTSSGAKIAVKTRELVISRKPSLKAEQPLGQMTWENYISSRPGFYFVSPTTKAKTKKSRINVEVNYENQFPFYWLEQLFRRLGPASDLLVEHEIPVGQIARSLTQGFPEKIQVTHRGSFRKSVFKLKAIYVYERPDSSSLEIDLPEDRPPLTAGEYANLRALLD